MANVFLTIVNMSFMAAFIIAAICIARLLLKKAPKIISYCLWAVVAFRLICPIAIESSFSLIPYSGDAVQLPDRNDPNEPMGGSLIDENVSFIAALEAAYFAVGDAFNGGLSGIDIDMKVSETAPDGHRQAYHSEVWIIFGSYIWSFGFIVLFIYGIASYLLLKRRMRGSVHVENNIYEADNIKSPFVLGVFKPKIYLPVGLSEQERGYVILHEQTHIKRNDHIIKFGAYFVLCLHWFNPLVWIAFILMGVDMEMSCDERVLKRMGNDIKKDYSLSLLSLATEKRIIGGSPLAFGESGIKTRIKNVLNFKKPSRIIIVAAVALVAVLSVGFAMNRIDKINNKFPMNGINLSDLQTDDIIQRVVQITGAKDSMIFVPGDNNFSIQVTENFDWQLGGTISFLFSKDGFGTERVYSSQLRIMAHNEEFFVTSADRREMPENQFYLKDYLDALKYLPQDLIHNMSLSRGNPGMYQLTFRPVDYESEQVKIFYNKHGIIENEVTDWAIMFDISPAHSVDSNNGYIGYGTDIIRLYYVAEAPRFSNSESYNLTLDDIRILAAKGDTLQYSDLPNLRQSLLSSTMGGYNPTLYGVEGGYRLLVNFNDTLNPESGIRSIQLEIIWESGGSGIDIRYNDVDEFIRTHPSHPAIIGEEALAVAERYTGKKLTFIDVDWWEREDEFPHHSKDPAKQALNESLDTIGQTVELFIDAEGGFIAVGRYDGTVYTYDNGKWSILTNLQDTKPAS